MTGDANVGDGGDFLASSDARSIDWSKPSGAPVAIETVEVLFGQGERPLEIAIATSAAGPKADDVRKLWKLRANRGAPVLLVVLHRAAGETTASVIGTEGDPAPIQGLSRGRVERIAAAALDEPNRHQAIRTLDRLLGSVSREGLTAGVINAGLFAAHELTDGVPRRADWDDARGRSFPLLGKTGRELLDALGYRFEPKGPNLLALSDATTQQAIAVVLDEAESFDRTSSRFGGVSPVSRALAQAQQERLPWVIALRRNQVRLYPADPDVGVGRKGLTETYIELDLTLLDDSDAGYLALLFSPEALAKGGSVEEILHNSAVYATDLGARLRSRIHEDVVPDLAVAVARRMGASTEVELNSAYHRTLIILFRLLFVAYAEDRGLLPFERNPRYTRNALKTYAKDFAEDPAQVFSPESTSIWEDLVQVWNAIDSGEPRWDVPAYNGGLFATDDVHPDGAAVTALGLTNAEIGPALMAMLVDADALGERGPVDFRSLSVREFGTIYEGLLESSLSIAPSDLSLDREQTYVPAKDGDEVVVQAGGVYFHNASGQRKSTGSYFTKSFAVEHLLDTALEPAIIEHLERVKALIDLDDTRKRAAEDFFDFRVADLAMGSGHFLVAAIDRIEARFSAFLSENPLPAVADELARLEAVAREALGEEQGILAEIEPSLLLRRQIARRCIYGLDINLIAVELARLAIWIHTFVPGLPMSSLDHGLVHGNSLTGMGTVEEALGVLDPQRVSGQSSLFSASIDEALNRSRARLADVARASEATKKEVREAALEYSRALDEAAEARALMDVAVGVRLHKLSVPMGPEDALSQMNAPGTGELARCAVEALSPAHFPCLFPEVLLRSNPGFDVIIGNPPWDKVRFEAQQFWVTRVPGFNSLSASDRDSEMARLRVEFPQEAAAEQREASDRQVLQDYFSGAYVHQGRGHHDYAKLFVERAVSLLRRGGRIGYVLPRQALVLGGWAGLRSLLLSESELLAVQARNKGGWLFEGVHHSYMVALLTMHSGDSSRLVTWPAVVDVSVLQGIDDVPHISLSREELATLSENLVVPWFETSEGIGVFEKMRTRPRLISGRGWIAGTSETRWDYSGSGQHRAYATATATNETWSVLMTRHVSAFEIAREVAFQKYVASPQDLVNLDNGVVMESGAPVLGPAHPTIAYRYPSRNDDARTVIAAALPEHGFVPSTGYVHTIRHPEGTSGSAVLALLGYLNSLVCDWWARRLVDRHVTAPVVNGLPLPDWGDCDVDDAAQLVTSILRRRGVERLAGGVVLMPNSYEDSPQTELVVALNRLAFKGFGMSVMDAGVVLDDFSDRAVSAAMRASILRSMSGETA